MAGDRLLRSALAYAERLGWAVVPLWPPTEDGRCACGRPDCGSPGKHPIGPLVPRGVHDARADADVIRGWWSRYSQANIGIACRADLFVLDVDGPEGAGQLEALLDEQGALPDTPIQRTGNGRQILFRADGTALGNRVKFLRGLDTRAAGGLFVAPPSRHYSGRDYVWEVSPLDVSPAPIPPWLGRLVAAGGGSASERGALDTAAALAGVPEGERDRTLFRLACKLRRADVPLEIAERLVLEAAARCTPPFPTEQACAKVRGAFSRYPPRAATAPAVDDVHSDRGSDPYVDAPPQRDDLLDEPEPLRQEAERVWAALGADGRARFSAAGLNDVGNGQRLGLLAVPDHRFVAEWECWISFDGRRFVRDPAALGITRAAKLLPLLIARTASSLVGDLFKEVMSWSGRTAKRDRLAAAIHLARSEPGVAVSFQDLDQHPLLLNVANGLLDLRSGELGPHDSRLLLTRLAPVEFHDHATAPRWERFVREIFPDPALREYMQRALGLSLTGVPVRVVFVFWGTGRNGKTLVVEVLLAVLGDYACNASPAILLEGEGTRHPTEIADLYGRRLVVVSEFSPHASFSVERLKRLSGGDTLVARRMRENFWSFRPTHKLVLLTNHKPMVTDETDSTWDRIRLVPFALRVLAQDEVEALGGLPEGHVLEDPNLLADLRREASGVLSWLLRGCLLWQEDGTLVTPTVVKAETSRYREESNPLAEFLTDACVVEETAWVAAAALHTLYDAWAAGSHRGALGTKGGLSVRTFARWLRSTGCRDERRRGADGKLARGWTGLRPRRPEDTADV